jgi:Transposase IS200 like
LLEKIKKSSSAWIKTQGDQYASFFWQAGYGCFSVGYSQLDELVRYIEKQELHHRTKTFQDEYRELLRKYRMDFDERHVWDQEAGPDEARFQRLVCSSVPMTQGVALGWYEAGRWPEAGAVAYLSFNAIR